MRDNQTTPTPKSEVPTSPPQPLGNVYLIGYRGTGKSTVARLLGAGLGWPWCDLDEVLEARAEQSIREIFASEGEAGFRLREAALLEEVARLQRQVVATGGGIVLSATNRRLLRKSGRVIWLRADSHTLWQRLQRDPTTADRRPKLSVGGAAEVEELLKAREPFYRECADCTVETVGRPAEEVASLICSHLNLS